MNILGEAKDYLESKGIDTTDMSEEEIIQKYYEMLADEAVSGDMPAEDEQSNEDISGNSNIEDFLNANMEVINTLNDDQKKVFEELIDLLS